MSGWFPENGWIRLNVKDTTTYPPHDMPIETKIDDENGVRNQTELLLHRGLFFFPDMSMYVYYTPTHWRFSAGRTKDSE